MPSACSRSPRPAAAAMASNWSVTLAMALTTTNGRSDRRAFTMLATRSIAVASSTEVPPNFMTITAAPPGLDVGGRWSRQIALRLEEFSVEQRRSRCAANRVVREHSELVVQNAAWAQPSHGHGHAVAAVHIEARLRAVRRIVVHNGLRRRQRQLELLRSRAKVVECSDDFSGVGLLPQLYGNRLGVAVFDRNPIAVRRHAECGLLDMIAIQSSEELTRLLFHLLFLFGDIRDDVAQDVERGDARISCSTDRLHRGHENRLDAKFLMKRRERHHQSDGRAVRIGNNEATRLLAPALLFDEREMAGVHLRNNERNVFVHAKGAGVAYDGATGGGKLRLKFTRNAGVQRGKDHARRALRRGARHLHFAHPPRNRRLQPPSHCVAVSLPGGAVRSRQPCHFEPRMGFEHLDEALADNSGSAKNSDGNFLLLHRCLKTSLHHVCEATAKPAEKTDVCEMPSQRC